MRLATRLSLLPLALVCCAAAPARTPLEEIRAQYDTLEAGFATRNIPLILSRRSADFGARLPDGQRQTPEQMAEMLKGFFVLNQPPIRTHNAIRALRMEAPDTAVATIFQQATRYQILAGKRRLVRHDVTQQETWVRTPLGWRLAYVDSVRDRHRWVDGKPIDPNKPFDPKARPYKPPKP